MSVATGPRPASRGGEPDGATLDLSVIGRRALNETLQSLATETNRRHWTITNPRGAHALAVGLAAPIEVAIAGHVGYYCAGMNAEARIKIEGNAGPGVAETMVSGEVRVRGDASQSAGSSGRGGLLVIEGNAGARCGISMKGIDIVVGGNVGHLSAFMGQRGTLVVCGDAGEHLGDSLYEARLFVRGAVRSLGSDCEEQPASEQDKHVLATLLARAGYGDRYEPAEFRVFGSARRLYNFHVDHASAY